MGVYSGNRTNLAGYSDETVAANENYDYRTGAFEAMIENTQNDQEMFTAVISRDFEEAAGLLDESAILNEASGLAAKIKDFLMKAWAKIKGILKSFVDKINTLIMRDNKAFVNKYSKEVLTKDLSKLKYKTKLKKDATSPSTALDKLVVANSTNIADSAFSVTADSNLEKVNNGDYLDEVLSEFLGAKTDSSDFEKDMTAKVFDDSAEENEGLSVTEIRCVMEMLTESKTVISAINKVQTACDKYFKKALSESDKRLKGFAKGAIAKTNSADEEDVRKSNEDSIAPENLAYKKLGVQQTAWNRYIGCYLGITKKIVAESRAIFSRAVTFNPKSVKESTEFGDHVAEAAEYHVESLFEDYSI